MRFTIWLLLILLLVGCSGAEKSGENVESHYMLAVSYLQSGDPTMALKEFLLAEQLDEDDARVQNGLGQAYFYKRAYLESERHYLRALKLDQGNPQYQNNLAASYLEDGRPDDAIRYFKMAASNLLFARAEVAWTGVGAAYMQKGEYAEALEAFEAALVMNRRYAPGYVYRGDVFYALGKSDKAVADYRQALVFFPDFAQAYFKLGVAQMKLRATKDALNSFSRVVALVPDSDIGRQAANYVKVLK
jgi:tetratricopeptide (TPR) repeat protein